MHPVEQSFYIKFNLKNRVNYLYEKHEENAKSFPPPSNSQKIKIKISFL